MKEENNYFTLRAPGKSWVYDPIGKKPGTQSRVENEAPRYTGYNHAPLVKRREFTGSWLDETVS